MKKLFALLLLPSLAFAGKIGEKYIGAAIGIANVGFDGIYAPAYPTKEWDGFSFEIFGNLPIVEENTYGIDLYGSFLSGSSLEGPDNSKADMHFLKGLARTYLKINEFSIFANLGFSSGTWKIDGVEQVDDSTFSPGIGFETSIDKFTISPSIDRVNFGSGTVIAPGTVWEPGDGIIYTIPLSYQLNDKISLKIKYELGDFSEFIESDGTKNEAIYDSLMFGIDYKF